MKAIKAFGLLNYLKFQVKSFKWGFKNAYSKKKGSVVYSSNIFVPCIYKVSGEVVIGTKFDCEMAMRILDGVIYWCADGSVIAA